MVFRDACNTKLYCFKYTETIKWRYFKHTLKFYLNWNIITVTEEASLLLMLSRSHLFLPGEKDQWLENAVTSVASSYN